MQQNNRIKRRQTKIYSYEVEYNIKRIEEKEIIKNIEVSEIEEENKGEKKLKLKNSLL